MRWFANLFKQSVPPETHKPRSLVCSRCYETCSGDNAHVIPWWNEQQATFYTTFRCGNCWLISLQETRNKVAQLDSTIREDFCQFLLRHKYSQDAKAIRHASLDEAKSHINTLLDAIESGVIRLSPWQ